MEKKLLGLVLAVVLVLGGAPVSGSANDDFLSGYENIAPTLGEERVWYFEMVAGDMLDWFDRVYDHAMVDEAQIMETILSNKYRWHDLLAYREHNSADGVPDPLNRFDSYRKFNAMGVDWVMENVFQMKPTHTAETEYAYYHEGFYYIIAADRGFLCEVEIDAVYFINGLYYFEYTEWETFVEPPKMIGKGYVVASEFDYNDVKYWAYHGAGMDKISKEDFERFFGEERSVLSDKAPASTEEADSAGKTNYALAYAEIIGNMTERHGVATPIIARSYDGLYGATEGVVSCELMDFDGDGTPELYLLYVQADAKYARNPYVEQIYTFKDGAAIKVFEVSSDLQEDFWGISFFNQNGKIYMRYDTAFIMLAEPHFPVLQTEYELNFIKEFDGDSFKDVRIDEYRAAYAQSLDTLNANGYGEGDGYQIELQQSSYGGNYYVAKRESVKGEFVPDNETKHIHYVHYSTGDSTLEDVSFNALEMQRQLTELGNTVQITVTLNGKAIRFDQPPIIEDGRTLVPMRAIFEAMGATVFWDADTQTVAAVKSDITLTMQIGNPVMTKNGQPITLDVPPKIVGGRTLAPARAVAEGFGANVDWDGETQTVVITD